MSSRERSVQPFPPAAAPSVAEPDAAVTIRSAATDAELEQILALQRRFHTRTLEPDVQRVEGFVYAEHTLPLLQRMAAELPQAIAVADGHVVGYCLALARTLPDAVPALAPLFAQLARCRHRGRPLAERRFFVGGQVCVDRAYRGRGLMAALYAHLGRVVPPDHELCVTEIATRNVVSLRAHERMGFEVIERYVDDQEDWAIVAWPLRGGA